MSENRRSEGILVTLTNVTAASNLNAGDPIALSGNTVYTLGLSTTGFGNTAQAGFHFVGVLDEDYSAGDTVINAWTEGVFEFTFSSAITTAFVGEPVFPDSGQSVVAAADGTTGQGSIGTIVGLTVPGGSENSGQQVQVKINPLRYRIDRYVPAATATAAFGASWPIITH